ncbi:MAG: M48 family metallopeptidase [Clostridia bacterium]|nr:M48 family metallopeptidase [Clostridia bacterium]
MNFKVIAVLILIVVYLYGLFLDVLRYRSAHNPVPKNVADVYDADTYLKWKAYHGEKVRFGILTAAVSFVIDLVLILTDAYAAFARLFPDQVWWQLFAVMLLSALATLPLIPFSWYDTMHIEEKYGFNRTSGKTFFGDKVKEFILNLLLMVGLASMVMGLHKSFGDWLILAFAVFATLFLLFITFLSPFFSRIFNKFTPLPDGELKEGITKLLEKNGYKVRAIQVMDASRRSTKSNAYFTGFGKMKTIVLYDTLISTMTTDEILAVFAHEMGHGLHKDTLKNHILVFLQMLVLGVLAWATLRYPEIFRSFGFAEVNYGFALLLIMSVEFALVSPLFGLLASWFSRRAEYRADAQAVQEGYGDALIRALKKLSRENFADLSPSPILVALEYSHPTLSQRIAAIEALSDGR